MFCKSLTPLDVNCLYTNIAGVGFSRISCIWTPRPSSVQRSALRSPRCPSLCHGQAPEKFLFETVRQVSVFVLFLLIDNKEVLRFYLGIRHAPNSVAEECLHT